MNSETKKTIEWWECGGNNGEKTGRDLLYQYLVEVLKPLGLDGRILVHDYVCRTEKQPEEPPKRRRNCSGERGYF